MMLIKEDEVSNNGGLVIGSLCSSVSDSKSYTSHMGKNILTFLASKLLDHMSNRERRLRILILNFWMKILRL